MMLVGELQDGLAFDHAYVGVTGKPLSHHLIPLFAAHRARDRLIFSTKSTLIKHAMKLEPTPQVVFSWSVNADYVGRRFRRKVPGSVAKAVVLPQPRRMREAGWPIRLRLDPMIPYRDDDEDWQRRLRGCHRPNQHAFRRRWSRGALRRKFQGLATAAGKNGRPTDLFDYLSEKDPSGFKYRLPFEQQVELYRFAIDRLDRPRIIPRALQRGRIGVESRRVEVRRMPLPLERL